MTGFIRGNNVFIKTEEGYFIGLDNEGVVSDLAISRNANGFFLLAGNVDGTKRVLVTTETLFTEEETEASQIQDRDRIAGAILRRMKHYLVLEQDSGGRYGYIPEEIDSFTELLKRERDLMIPAGMPLKKSLLTALNRANARRALLPLKMSNLVLPSQLKLQMIATRRTERGYAGFVPVIIFRDLTADQKETIMKKLLECRIAAQSAIHGRTEILEVPLSGDRLMYDDPMARRTATNEDADFAFIQACNRRVLRERLLKKKGNTSFDEREFRQWERKILHMNRQDRLSARPSASKGRSTIPVQADTEGRGTQARESSSLILDTLMNAAAKKVRKDLDL